MGFLKKEKLFQAFVIGSVFMALLNIASFIFFDIALVSDGSHELFNIINSNSFYFFEKGRQTFRFFRQLPVWLFLNLTESTSLTLLIKLYSLGLVWIHIPSLLICWFMLHTHTHTHTHSKISFFFPLFAFFTGPLTAFNTSVSAALPVSSWLWAVSFIIYYSDLSLKSHKILLLASLMPLFQSHELMSYMSLFLIGLCFFKLTKEKDKINRYLIIVSISFLGFLFNYHVFDLIYLQDHAARIENRAYFLRAFFELKILFQNSQINGFILIALLLKLFLLIELFTKKYKAYCFSTLFLFILLLVLFFDSSLGFNPKVYFWNARFYPPVFTLPFTMLIWLIYEEKLKNWRPSKLFLITTAFFFMSLTFYRIQSDLEFYKYRKKISQSLSNCKGALKYSDYGFYGRYLDWNTLPKSLLYPKRRNIYNIMVNHRHCIKNLSSTPMALSQKQELCDRINNWNFPKKLLDSDFQLETRFFNFTPLYEAYSNGISACSAPH